MITVLIHYETRNAMHAQLLTFVLIQIAMICFARVFLISGLAFVGDLFSGVLAAEIALLGVWTALGRWRVDQRLAVTCLGIVGVFAFAITGPPVSVFEFMAGLLQFVVVVGVVGWIRRNRGLTFVYSPTSVSTNLVRVSIFQLLGFTAFVGLFLGMTQFLNDHRGTNSDSLLILVIAMVGLISTLPALITVVASLGVRSWIDGLFAASAVGVLTVCQAGFVYTQTNSHQAALKWTAVILVQCVVVCISILALRPMGYRTVSEGHNRVRDVVFRQE